MKFNEILVQERKKQGLSQEELGVKINVARQTISKWELGETTPEMDKLIQLSEIFEISMDELVGKEEGEIKKEYHVKFKMHYEYKSKTTIKEIPLVHINVGYGIHKAKGIIAIGNIASGVIALGGISVGLISLGAISIGLLTFGALVLGLLAMGAVAIGGIAIGGVAVGYLAIGGLAMGVYSIGGAAIANRIAMGAYAKGHIAIGDVTDGAFCWSNIMDLPKGVYGEIRERILIEYPNISKFILQLFS